MALLATASPAQQPEQGPTTPRPGQADRPAPQPKYWTTDWSFNDIDVGKLANRLEAIGIDTGFDLQGTVSVQFEVGIPINALRDGAAYRFDGTLTSPSLVIDGVRLKEFSTHLVYRDGTATLQNLSSMVVDHDSQSQASGSVRGTATIGLVPRDDIDAAISISDLPIAPLSELVAKVLGQSKPIYPNEGSFSGNLKLHTPLDTVDDITNYQLDGNLSGKGLRVANLPPADFEVRSLKTENQQLQINDFSLTAQASTSANESIRLSGNARLPLHGTGDFEARLFGDDVPVGRLTELLLTQQAENATPLVAGKVDFRINARGQLSERFENSTWNLDGTIASPRLAIAGVDLGTIEHNIELTPDRFNIVPVRDIQNLPKSFRIGALRSEYSLSDESLEIKNIDATLFEGRVGGKATVPLNNEGLLSAQVDIQGLHPRVELNLAGRNVPATAGFDADLNWQVPIDALEQPSRHQGQLTFSVSNISLGEANVGDLQGTATADSGDISLRARGKIFDGTVAVETKATALADDRWSDLPARFSATELQFSKLSLDRMYEIATRTRTELTGSASGIVRIHDWNLSNGSNGTLPTTELKLQLAQLNHRSKLLSRSLNLTGRVTQNRLDITSLYGDYAGGNVRVKGRVFLFDEGNLTRPRADLRATASRVDLSRGMWFLGDIATNFQGRVSASATISGSADSIRVRGSTDGRDLILYGLPLGDAHSSLTADADVSRQSWTVRFPAVRSSQGGGQVEGELSLASTRRGGNGIDLESRWRTRRVDFVRLIQQLGQSTSVAQGEITGDLTLSGKSIESIDDLNGRFRFTLGQTRGAAIPGLLGISRFLGPISLVNQRFDAGEAKGVIGRGAVTIDEFWVGSDSALVRADGKVFLRSKRMDLNALVATGDYRNIAVNLTQMAQQYALRSLLPSSAILDISELLRDRTLVVNIVGTLQDPIVRLQPVQTFREEAARFLLREGQRLMVTGVTAGTIDSLDGK
ncbi:AsmA family protein [Rhodopirellula sallentina]|uniref:AsmA family protein n=1 Tax=Rhodopirellula sallentina TaxID=1263869 RepID=UPI001F42937E|nr:AsmA-like C-terminal region-containing protein [Rhodopirellula sallentina]